MSEKLMAKSRENLQEGELICFVGVHILKWERYMREYGIPNFDFAFIDGSHKYDDVKFDFECVKRCGRVLFHDYDCKRHPDVTKFVDELSNVIKGRPFAYWES